MTPFIRNSGFFKLGNISYKEDLSSERWTVDEPEDFTVVEKNPSVFSPERAFWLVGCDRADPRARPEIFLANRHFIRNEGYLMGTGQKLWKRARKIIPGGNMLLSKRAELFLPEFSGRLTTVRRVDVTSGIWTETSWWTCPSWESAQIRWATLIQR